MRLQTKSFTYKKHPKTLLEWLDNMLIKYPDVTLADISRQLGLARNAAVLWRKGSGIPVIRAMQVAEWLGEDPKVPRRIGLMERFPELFTGKYAADDELTLSENEMDFIKLIRKSSVENPTMNEEQKAEFVAFLKKCKPAQKK